MNALEWLRYKARPTPRILHVEPMPATPTERPAPALQIAAATGITAAQAAANVAAVGAAMRRGDPLVSCGCWPRYIDRCRCPDNASRLPL